MSRFQKLDNERVGTGPALVQGNIRSAYALFIEDKNGDLVDIEYFCSADGWNNPELENALPWPAFDFGKSNIYCRNCKRLINSEVGLD